MGAVVASELARPSVVRWVLLNRETCGVNRASYVALVASVVNMCFTNRFVAKVMLEGTRRRLLV